MYEKNVDSTWYMHYDTLLWLNERKEISILSHEHHQNILSWKVSGSHFQWETQSQIFESRPVYSVAVREREYI